MPEEFIQVNSLSRWQAQLAEQAGAEVHSRRAIFKKILRQTETAPGALKTLQTSWRRKILKQLNRQVERRVCLSAWGSQGSFKNTPNKLEEENTKTAQQTG